MQDRETPTTILVLGGCRSGKSRYAEDVANQYFTRKTLIATLKVGDDEEMMARAEAHRQSRAEDWRVVEEPIALLRVLEESIDGSEVVFIDCITLWITNMLLRDYSDRAVLDEVEALADKLKSAPITIIMVANEVGLGIVPEFSLARRFRDLAGSANQKLAMACEKVVFMAAGIPMFLKGHQ